ncbi:MAG: hypothetical protein JST00_34245 [Deltaproteobacteria bacterium]|nr:hypothetical protein [Deltaproteobacteria bacterium]
MGSERRVTGFRRRAIAAMAVVVAAVSAGACAAPEGDEAGSQEAAATERKLVHENAPYWWAPSSYEEMRSSQSLGFGQTLPAAIADDEALTVRLQTWLDRFHAITQRDVERETGKPFAAPRPIAKVLHSKSTFNAWVSGVPACIGAKFGKPEAATGIAAFVENDRVYQVYADACIRPTEWKRSELVSFWNADKPACSLAEDGDALVTRGAKCDASATPPADDVAIVAASPFIHFSSDLLAELDEDTVAVVAAHELAHYYRGHTTARGRAKYGFWYEREDGRKKAPVPAQNAAELEAAYREVVQAGRPLGGPSFASRYSARTRPFLLAGIAPLLQARTEQGFVCAAARDAIGPWVSTIRQSEVPSAEDRAAFLAFESKLAACASRLELGGDPGAKSISAGSVLFAAAADKPGPKVKISLKWGDTLGDFLARFDAQSKELDAKAERFAARLKSNKIGLYTTEQEADEIALELSTKAGLTSEQVLRGWLDFMRAVDRSYARAYAKEDIDRWRAQTGELDAETCSALLASDFTKDGRPVSVNMGVLEEPHHAGCYRLFNLWREARARQFVPAAPPEALSPAWSVLKSRAAELTATAPEPPPPPAAPAQ